MKALSGKEPIIILEETDHYHRGLVSYPIRRDYKHFIINPLQSKRARNTQKLRSFTNCYFHDQVHQVGLQH
ncbi:hypothetical protein AB4Z17_28630 [Paenibacillus sp. TAF43_2]